MIINSIYSNPDSFSRTIVEQFKDSTDIEQSSISNKFANDELLHYETTDMKLDLRDNILMNKYYDKIKRSCTSLTLTPELNQKYNYRPEALSSDKYNTPNLWYLILYLNGCEDVSEFHDLDYVLLPDMSVIAECLSDEEYIESKKIQ